MPSVTPRGARTGNDERRAVDLDPPPIPLRALPGFKWCALRPLSPRVLPPVASCAVTVTATPPPSRDRPATERAYDYTKEGITSGLLRGGDLISEGDVAQALQISRTPVREAFLRLSSEGLLRLYPKRGALIVPVTPGEVSDVLTARQLIEPWAVAVAANLPVARRDPLGERLNGLLATQRQALVEERLPDFHQADCDFHLAIVEAAGNELLTRFYQSLRDRQLRMLDSATVHDPSRRTSILDQHESLLAAIRDGEAFDATTVIAEHLGGTAEAVGVNGAVIRP
jgi:DNA-binding GntR family transcriptional regulator